MNCPICAQEMKDDSNYCIRCGRKIPRCPTCGKAIRKKSRFCVYDGTMIPEEVLAVFSEKAAKDNPITHSTVTETVTREPEMFCINCGNPCEEGQVLCEECRRIEERKDSRPPRKHVPVLVGFILVLALLVSGTVGYLFLNRKSSEPDTEQMIFEKTGVSESSSAAIAFSAEDTENVYITEEESVISTEVRQESTDSTYDGDKETVSTTESFNVDDAVAQIQDWYYNPSDSETSAVVAGGTGGWSYSREYYFHNGNLYFAFVFDGTEEHRLYFKDNQMIRYIDEYGNVFDYGNLDEYSDWEKRVLEEAYTVSQTASATAEGIPAITMSAVEKVTATSSLSEYGMTHSPDRLIDGDLTKAWVEGASGDGIGEAVVLTFDGVYEVSGLDIYAGYQKSRDLYNKNSRPSRISVTFSDGTSEAFELDDYYGQQRLWFTSPVKTSCVTIAIQAVYSGNKYEDTVISELSLF